jgi:hypothetical protein
MAIRTLEGLGEVAGKRVFVRVDHNVPLKDGGYRRRSIRASLHPPSPDGGALVVASHLGYQGQPRREARPRGRAPGDLLGREVLALTPQRGRRGRLRSRRARRGRHLENPVHPREEENDLTSRPSSGPADAYAGLSGRQAHGPVAMFTAPRRARMNVMRRTPARQVAAPRPASPIART